MAGREAGHFLFHVSRWSGLWRHSPVPPGRRPQGNGI